MKRLANKGITLFVSLLLPTAAQAQGITNPLAGSGISSINDIIGKGISFLMGLAGVLALLGVVYGGVLIISNFGDEGKVKSGKNIIFWSVMGLVVVGLSYVIVTTVVRDLLGIGAAG